MLFLAVLNAIETGIFHASAAAARAFYDPTTPGLLVIWRFHDYDYYPLVSDYR